MIEKTNSYQAGNTIRLVCTFKDFNGVKINPTNTKISFYNYKYERLQQTTLSITNRLETGVYFYNYITPSTLEQRIIYEWYGEINGLPSIKRGSFRTVFI